MSVYIYIKNILLCSLVIQIKPAIPYIVHIFYNDPYCHNENNWDMPSKNTRFGDLYFSLTNLNN